MRIARAEQIARNIAQQVEQGHLAPGTRLGSVRQSAVEFGVSKNTMVEAYDRLVALGYLEPKRGSGFYVTRPRPKASTTIRPAHVSEAIDLVSLLREQLNQHYSVRVGDGRPPASWMEGSELGRHLRLSMRGGERVEHGYGAPQGYGPLRELIAGRLIERSIHVSAEQILLTFGANHALDLIVRHFIEPGDAVLVDSPGYYPLFGKLRLARANVIGVRRTADGPDPDDLEAKAAQYRPRLFFTQTLAHNPTGTSMSPAAVHRLLQQAERLGMILVEDDPFADLLPPLTPRLATLDRLDRVIYVGTFSKTLSASLRTGYIAASAALIRSLTDVKMLTVVNSSGYVERLIHELMADGHYRHHLNRLRERVARATSRAISDLADIGLKTVIPPAGGYYLWCELPDGTDDVALAQRASERGIFLAPSSIFTVERDRKIPALRINVAYADDPVFLDFLRNTAWPDTDV
jgi:DNA-binding transcriptional MocR family regulator